MPRLLRALAGLRDERGSLTAALAGDPLLALDLGARGGLPAHWTPFLDLLAVDACEPDADDCRRQQATAPANVHWFPIGLAGASGRLPFYVLAKASGSSLYPPNLEQLGRFNTPAYHRIERVVEIEVYSFADFLETFDRPVPNLIKLDTQGSELDILASLRPEQWEQVLAVETEVEFLELYQGQPLFPDVHAFLNERGFELYDLRTQRRHVTHDGVNSYYLERDLGLVPGRRDLSAQLVHGDALYLRPPGAPALRSRPAVLKFLVVCLIYRYFDLALHLLESASADQLLAAAEAAALRRGVVRRAPRPWPWQRAGRVGWLCRGALQAVGFDRRVTTGWTRNRWPNQ